MHLFSHQYSDEHVDEDISALDWRGKEVMKSSTADTPELQDPERVL